MARLNQIIAIEKGIKSRSFQELTDAHHSFKNPHFLLGFRAHIAQRMKRASSCRLKSTKVQIKSEEIIKQTVEILTRLFDVTATKDWANGQARADVVVDGNVLLSDVPVTYLLFLEKQLVDLHTFVRKLPVLDASETWAFDASADCWATEAIQTVRTKKIPRNHVKAEATEHHPAQVEVYYEDVP